MKTKEPKQTPHIPIPEGLETRLVAAIDSWEAREKTARRRRRHRLLGAATGLAAAAVVAVAVFMAQQPRATLPNVAQTVPPPVGSAVRPLSDQAATRLEPRRAVAAETAPSAAPVRKRSLRPTAPGLQEPAAQAPAVRPAKPAEASPQPTAQQLAAVQEMLHDYWADEERQMRLVEDVMHSFEEIENNPIAYSI